MQVTAFMAFLAMDTVRMQRGLADCVPCLEVHTPEVQSPPLRDFEVSESEPHSPLSNDDSMVSRFRQETDHTWLQCYMHNVHAPILARPITKLCVVVAFTLLALTSLTLMQRMEVGLDLAVALPSDSYLQRYYRCASYRADSDSSSRHMPNTCLNSRLSARLGPCSGQEKGVGGLHLRRHFSLANVRCASLFAPRFSGPGLPCSKLLYVCIYICSFYKTTASTCLV